MSAGNNLYDVVIAGGGPAGASAAIHLAQKGVRVLLAEQKKFPREKLCGEFISPECLEHFARLGVLEEMTCAGGSELAQTIFYTASGRSVSVSSEWFGSGMRGALGLSRAEMDDKLLKRARGVGVEVLEEATVAGLLFEDGRVGGVRLNFAGGATRECSA
ncbi:MAG: FAD-dependent oxidoreductase, partial [Pyrinomonadaceae bacterium]